MEASFAFEFHAVALFILQSKDTENSSQPSLELFLIEVLTINTLSIYPFQHAHKHLTRRIWILLGDMSPTRPSW